MEARAEPQSEAIVGTAATLDRAAAPSFNLRVIVKNLIRQLAAAADRMILLIAGPGCTGKSTFAEELAGELGAHDQPTSVLDLDCYLVERAKRQTVQGLIGGYHPAAYRLDQARRDITILLGGGRIVVSPYDKKTGCRSPPVELAAKRHLIIEGSMALRDPIYRGDATRLFLDAPRGVLYGNRRRRELALGFTIAAIDQKFAALVPDYEGYIAPQRSRAQLIVEVDEHYTFRRLTLGSG